MIGGRFAPLTTMSNEDTDIDSVITTFNTAVTETASEILGKHRQKKQKPGLLQKFLICATEGQNWEEKKTIWTWTIWEIQGSEQHQEVHEKGKRKLDRRTVYEIEENLKENNSKKAYQLVKDLTTVK